MTESGDAQHAARAISHNPALFAEVRAVAPVLSNFAKPCDPEELVECLMEAWLVYGLGDREEGEWARLLKVYIEALSPLPMIAIRVGLLNWNRQAEYFPKPGQLYKFAEEHANLLRTVAYRARKAAEFVENRPPPLTTEERAAQRQKLIDDGIMTADGKMNLKLQGFQSPARVRQSPHEVAAGLRALAASPPRTTAPPPPDDVPEAI